MPSWAITCASWHTSESRASISPDSTPRSPAASGSDRTSLTIRWWRPGRVDRVLERPNPPQTRRRFPEIAEAMLNVLYPHYLRPVPTMAIVQCTVTRRGRPDRRLYDPARDDDRERADRWRVLPLPHRLPADTLADRARQRATGRPSVQGRVLAADECRLAARYSPGVRDAEADVRKPLAGTLRFFLLGKAQYVYELYEALFVNVKDVALAASLSDTNAQPMGSGCLRQVGFAADEAMLPYSPRSLAAIDCSPSSSRSRRSFCFSTSRASTLGPCVVSVRRCTSCSTSTGSPAAWNRRS